MRRRLKIAWVSTLDSRLVQAACDALGADLIQCAPDNATAVTDPLCDAVILDLRSGARLDLLELGRGLKTAGGPAVVCVVSDDQAEAVDRIDAAKPDGILLHPLSVFQVRLVLGVALRSRSSPRRASPAASRPLSDVTPLAPLTRRETDVLSLFVDGHRVKSIARSCFISEGTVRAHLKSVFRKLNVRSQAELMDYFLKRKKAAAGS
jgi:DNA-binding NarL/FixJ family response regulator